MTISDMKIGSMLSFGKYGVNNENPYPIIWVKGTPHNDFITLNTIDYIGFDAPEEEFYHGNPAYESSDIHSFLNSDAQEWFNPIYPHEAPSGRSRMPRYYRKHYGFLYHFEEYEINAINSKTFNVNGCRVVSLVRLPDSKDIIGLDRFEVFKTKGVRPKATGDMLCSRTVDQFNENSYIPFWTCNRSDNDERVTIVGRDGGFEDCSPHLSSGLRPVCTIKQDISVQEHDNGIYYIEPYTLQTNVCTNEELFAFLGLTQS